jgi:hypothetical protein
MMRKRKGLKSVRMKRGCRRRRVMTLQSYFGERVKEKGLS